MDEYMKMSDVFCKSDAVETRVLVAFAVAVNYDDGVTPHEYAHHAIQYHDELVEMNKDLLSALEAVIEWFDMEADHSIEPDFMKRVEACGKSEDMARSAIAKAKGGAA